MSTGFGTDSTPGDVEVALGTKSGMPWKVTEPMQERIKFIEEWLTKRDTMVDLCRKYGDDVLVHRGWFRPLHGAA
jgi:hypothetical protein